eukprot:TRINITY_DN57001_c0_g1_i1.p2 TRINITY_DN57001_c0_g1~~TRINITY_DN57001_c0_g1_i1.p2  ORF type:complete len:106 (-),score=10.54 TRINITY_DN57001_c0_g1_i1:18-335(-)
MGRHLGDGSNLEAVEWGLSELWGFAPHGHTYIVWSPLQCPRTFLDTTLPLGLLYRSVFDRPGNRAVSYTHLRAHETPEHLVCRLLLEKKKNTTIHTNVCKIYHQT